VKGERPGPSLTEDAVQYERVEVNIRILMPKALVVQKEFSSEGIQTEGRPQSEAGPCNPNVDCGWMSRSPHVAHGGPVQGGLDPLSEFESPGADC